MKTIQREKGNEFDFNENGHESETHFHMVSHKDLFGTGAKGNVEMAY